MHQFLYSSTSAVSIFHSFADSGWRYCSALCLGVAVQLYCLGVAVQLCCLGVAAQLCCLGVAALLCCLGVAALLCCLGVVALLCTLLSWGGGTALHSPMLGGGIVLLSWGGGTALHSAILGGVAELLCTPLSWGEYNIYAASSTRTTDDQGISADLCPPQSKRENARCELRQ